jgi:catechol 2,3-dioxygenase-like lactoylglutathione lyase family enzyme
MQLGAFSVSLAVKDLERSRDFYESLGFAVMAGQVEHNYLVLNNGSTVIGLFQGMFEGNMLTFNPGWDQGGAALPEFTDVRELHAALRDRGIEPVQTSLEGDSGPGSFVVMDPDGNPVLVDQHV